ncbi:MAG: glycosyltransferase family 2 protein [Proteobacteria bacterium]|nr:glycosyltransferase family 2 protein [Pseudomonadota bacterium]
MKLIIQIPCYNEAGSIGITLGYLPRSLPGVDEVEWLIIDDGSTDRTVEEAVAHGVDHVVRLNGHQGLARAFTAGLEACLSAGADIIVNTDADNQYSADDIPALVQPILEGRAEIVIGTRPIQDIEHFSSVKKVLQRLGSWVVRLASNTDVRDAPSGFRAISREAAMRLHVFGEYTYTLETIIQAGQNGLRLCSVPVRTNKDLRPSRLVRSIPRYLLRSVGTIARIFVIYRPLRLFFPIAGLIFLAGIALGVRYLYLISIGEGAGHVQSVILAAAFLGIGTFVWLIGVIADLIATNRKLLEKVDWELQKLHEVVAFEGIAKPADVVGQPPTNFPVMGGEMSPAGTREQESEAGRGGGHESRDARR